MQDSGRLDHLTPDERQVILEAEAYHGRILNPQEIALGVAQAYWIGELDQDQTQSFLDQLHL